MTVNHLRNRVLQRLKSGSLIFLLFSVQSCNDETNSVSPIADITVREQVNLNTAEALPLKGETDLSGSGTLHALIGIVRV